MSKAVQALAAIQARVRAPKDQKNAFAGFNYRNAEGILDALKPLLEEQRAAVVMTDSRAVIDESRIICESTATLYAEDGSSIAASAFAEVDQTKKGNDASQRCGSASSYARKYALCGLFAIGTGDDPDAQDNRAAETQKPNKPTESRRNPAKVETAPSQGEGEQTPSVVRVSQPTAIPDARRAYEEALAAYCERSGKNPDVVREVQERAKGGRAVDTWTDAELKDITQKLAAACKKKEG